MVPTPKNKGEKPIEVTVDLNDLIRVTQPTLYFKVQKSIQDQNIILVDLNSGKPISGQVNLATIGLIQKSSLPPTKQKTPFGFPIKHQNSTPPAVTTKYVDRVEATLSAYQSEHPNDPLLIVIQVINQKHLEVWSQKILNLIPDFVTLDPKNKPVPSVVFEVETLCIPGENDPDSSIEAILNEIQKFRPETGESAISNDFVDGENMDQSDFEEV